MKMQIHLFLIWDNCEKDFSFEFLNCHVNYCTIKRYRRHFGKTYNKNQMHSKNISDWWKVNNKIDVSKWNSNTQKPKLLAVWHRTVCVPMFTIGIPSNFAYNHGLSEIFFIILFLPSELKSVGINRF